MSGNPQAGMQAFMEGKVKVQGDLTKLMAAQVAGHRAPARPGSPTRSPRSRSDRRRSRRRGIDCRSDR